jgi:hypothetical protein
MGQPDYNKAFYDGVAVEYAVQYEDGSEPVTDRYTLCMHALGELVVTSGQIVVCDPLVMPYTKPLADTVPRGRYPVILTVAETPDGDQRVACALLRLGERSAVRWEMAVPQGKTLSSLEPGHVFGYGVDSGKGCFMDAEAARALLAREKENIANNDDCNGLLEVLNRTHVHTWSRADLITDEATGANVIAFSSSWGDGFYTSYWGYDADDQRVALVTDFGVLDESWFQQ